VRGKIERGFADLGEHEVKNIAEPVRAYRVLAEGELAPSRRPVRSRRLVFAGLGFAVILVGATLWQLRAPAPETPPAIEVATGEPDDPILALPSGPSIAVLPFDNMSGDPEQEYFADGIAEDLITKLSRFPDYLVIARNTTFQYKGRAVDVREVGRELGARFVVEGSVRRSADTIRITVQLIDVETEGHLWADTYDRELTAENIFAVQDEITERLAGTIGDTFGIISLSGYEGSKIKNAASLSAYECVLGAHGYYATGAVPAEHARVRECLEQAVEDSPNYADAWAWLAAMYRDEHMFDFNPKPDPLERAEQAARRAVELQHDNQEGHLVLAHVYFFQHDLDAFRAQAEKMLAINPNSADALASTAYTFVQAGDWDRAIAMVEKAIRLNPNHPPWFHWIFYWDDFNKGEYQAALARIRKGVIPGYFFSHTLFAAVHGKLGNELEARQAIDELRALYPTYSLSTFREYCAKWNFPEHLMESMVDGLRKAGLPEAPPEAPTRPVIAVLPFDNMSGDPEQDYFADGLSEDLITRLAQYPDLAVIARNSSFQYKGQAVDVRRVADELGASFILEGSVRRSGDRLRVVAQLLDAADGTHVWTKTFERDLSTADIFDIQDEITTEVTGNIGSEYGILMRLDQSAAKYKPPESLEAYECVSLTRAYFEVETEAMHASVRDCLERAVAAEPQYAEAWAMLAEMYAQETYMGFNQLPDPLKRALEAARKAVEAGPDNQIARRALASAYYYRRDSAAFIAEAERAIAINPNDGGVLGWLGAYMAMDGEWQRGLAYLDKAMELSPLYPSWWNNMRCMDYYVKGDYAAALEELRKNRTPSFHSPMLMVMVHAQLGNEAETTAAITNLREIHGDISVALIRSYFEHWMHRESDLDSLMEGLRIAGLPEVVE
jgi:adenylate cyclase